MQLVFSLFAGLIITVALQLLLTSLGAALGLTVFKFSPQSTSCEEPPSSSSDFSLPITHVVGFGVALSLTTVLFCSSLAVTEFSQINEPRRGLVFGIILWSTYWLLLIWLSSTTIVSVANSIVGAAIGSSKRLIATLQTAIQGDDPPPSSSSQLLQELTAEVSQLSEQQAQLPELLTLQRDALLDDIQAHLNEQSDPSTIQAQTPIATDHIESPSASSRLNNGSGHSLKTMVSDAIAHFDLPSWPELFKQGLNQWDWSDWDLETLWQQIQQLTPEDSPQLFQDVILRDVETYLRNAPRWAFQPTLLEAEFSERLYDPDADPEATKAQLLALSPDRFQHWLQTRKDISTDQIDALTHRLVAMRDQVLHTLSSPSNSPPDTIEIIKLQKKLVAYCRYTNRDALTCSGIQDKVQTLLEQYENQSFPPVEQALDLSELQTILSKRRGITRSQVTKLIESLTFAWPSDQSNTVSGLSVNSFSETLHRALSESLQTLKPETVTLEDLKPTLNELLNLAEGQQLSFVDWSHLGAQLQIPANLQTELVTWLQTKGIELAKSPRPWILRTMRSSQDLYAYFNHRLLQYFQYQDKTALKPAQMAQDLGQVIQETLKSLPPLSDVKKISIDLSLDQLNPDQLALWQHALEQRRDLTQTEIHDILDGVRSSWHTVFQGTQDMLQTVSSFLPSFNSPRQSAEDLIETLQRRVSEPLEAIQTNIEQQANDITTALQQQTDAAQNQVQIAAWWLFGSLLLSGLGTAIAGWLAVKY